MTPAQVRIAVCDYGVGNLHSVRRALEHAGAVVTVTGDDAQLDAADGVVLPGVGAFGPAAQRLRDSGLDRTITAVVERGRPLLGVCLGFQLLYEESEESGGSRGLGLLAGTVTRIPSTSVKVPHMGWNRIRQTAPCSLFEGIPDGSYGYFVHSYAAAVSPATVAVTEYAGELTAAVASGSILGTQFHPEKSGSVGLQMYRNFVSLCSVVHAK